MTHRQADGDTLTMSRAKGFVLGQRVFYVHGLGLRTGTVQEIQDPEDGGDDYIHVTLDVLADGTIHSTTAAREARVFFSCEGARDAFVRERSEERSRLLGQVAHEDALLAAAEAFVVEMRAKMRAEERTR